MSVWTWVHQFNKEARERGDQERLRLFSLFNQATSVYDEEPTQTMKLLREGRQLAERLGEPRWVLFFDHWILQEMLGAGERLDDYLALAVRASVEASRPQYRDLPQRICLHDDLVRGYLKLGVRGLQTEIEANLAFMEKEVSPDLECSMCTIGKRITFEQDLGRYDNARAVALRLLQVAESKKNPHYQGNAHDFLCWLAARQGDAGELAAHAEAGEQCTIPYRSKKMRLAQFILWQAVAARMRHEETAARRLFRSAVARIGRLKLPHSDIFDAWCEFHELAGDYAKSLKIRDRQQQENQGKGNLHYEWQIQLARCRLLARMGKLGDADVAAARALGERLRKPELYLCDLDRLLAGDLSGKW